ncbi:MAG: oligosaccharide flippase family protein [Acidobacteria bacterium]|nr:oligosaccharide flippase family protein [Acidobacteriota bacterium]
MPASESTASYLRRGGLALIAVGLAGFFADYLFNVGLARVLPPHEYGDFRVAAAFAAFFGVAVLLGGDRAAPKALAGPLERGETARAWEYLRFYFELALGLWLVLAALTWTASYLHVGHVDPKDHHAIAWVVLIVPFSAAGALVSRALQSAKRPVLASWPWRIGVPLLSLVLLAVLAWIRQGRRILVQEAVLVAMASVVVVTAAQWWLLRRLDLPTLGRDPASRTPRLWVTASMPMMGAFLVMLALNQSDLYFLELLGEEHEVGHYAAAATSAHFLLIVQTALVGLVAPLTQPALERGREAFESTFRQSQRLMLSAVVPVAAVLWLGATPILGLFGPSFVNAVPVLDLLTASNLAWAVAALSVLRLQYTGHGPWIIFIAFAALVADSLGNLLLIPTYGMQGAAASTLATTILAAAAVLAARRRLGA